MFVFILGKCFITSTIILHWFDEKELVEEIENICQYSIVFPSVVQQQESTIETKHLSWLTFFSFLPNRFSYNACAP